MTWTTPAANGPLDYPNRHYGNDHNRYSWSMLTDRAPITWPQGDGLALFVVVPLQFFPLNPQGKPVKVAGNMTMPYPDLRHYTLRDYGNRVGIHRVHAAVEPVAAGQHCGLAHAHLSVHASPGRHQLCSPVAAADILGKVATLLLTVVMVRQWRYVAGRDGEEYGFHGCFHEVRPDELIVQTFTFEGVAAQRRAGGQRRGVHRQAVPGRRARHRRYDEGQEG